MDKTTFVELVNKNFDFLFKEYGFSFYERKRHPKSPIPPEESRVFMQSQNCNIDILIDRRQVLISFAPTKLSKSNHSDWYDLSELVSFLTKGPNQINWSYTKGWIENEAKGIDYQMNSIRTILEPHIGEIINFFKEENFSVQQKDFDNFIEKRWEERKKQWAEQRKNKPS